MAHLQVTVTNSLGKFSGFISLAANSTIEDAQETTKALIGNINTIKTLSIEDTDGAATVFSEAVLRESVITVLAVD